MPEEQIRELAYSKWQCAGCPEGDGIDFWLQAEEELTPNPQRVCDKQESRKVAAKVTAKRK